MFLFVFGKNPVSAGKYFLALGRNLLTGGSNFY